MKTAMTKPSVSTVCRCLPASPVMAIAIAGLFVVHPARAAENADSVIEVSPGKEFAISLESNISTGYGWQLAKPLDGTIVKSVRNDYQSAPQASDGPPLVGAPGKEVWTFKALKSGKTAIDFKYVRSWEKDKAPAETRSFSVRVKADGYLKDGKLKERLEILELQGGVVGFTGNYYAVEPDGSWSTGSVIPAGEKKREPKATGKLTDNQLDQLAKELLKQDLDNLPSHGKPVVNPKVIKIRFGEKVSVLQPNRGDSLVEDELIRARFGGITQVIKMLCAESKNEN